ncbi:murein L,D-transpeptidase catalytic domain family protein [Salegentibacter sediminis]|uniref:murein L,D-transpeptidase catalytic domain family protein n=1 Tax=Salegentibacter sediminis TaxID=1930251 RepID=UPI0009BED99A|nr:murein L,D-transpeptidase catalytic domain family protein [Salegentibacter sediminis]
MIYKILTITGILIFSFAFTTSSKLPKTLNSKLEASAAPALVSEEIETFSEKVATVYGEFAENSASMPTLKVFERAMTGYSKLDAKGKVGNQLLTVIDFGLSSTTKRMWILDMNTKNVLFHTYVSHGKNTGGEFATKFSNTVNSLQSSLGFYVTGKTYYGKNGLSLYLDGQEKGFNHNARKRYVVVHGADYAEPSFIDRIGRLGRSYGCPAVPNSIAKDLIEKIKGRSVIYIHKEDKNYLKNSKLLNSVTAA